MASSSTSALSDEVMWEELPEELLRQVLGHVMLAWRGVKEWRGSLRGVSRRWRAVHDGACQRLRVRDGMTDEVMHALCGRLPALTFLNLHEVRSLTEDGLRAVGGLTTLTKLILRRCNVTHVVLRELRDLPALTHLNLNRCTQVTDVGVRELRGLTKLTILDLGGCTQVTDVGVRELRGLTALTKLNLGLCSHVTNAGVRELRGLTALTELNFRHCFHVTNVGLQHLTSLSALTKLYLGGTSTTQAGRDALKAVLPALTIESR